ncbi:MAG: hypothetical protein OQJ81_03085, partial [Melioribacteraceae bacterium]|nr:hypothetical protein [Melioribacteraceae bacterium]
MKVDHITEKLSFQVKSFQESFNILSNSNSLSGMAKQFERILRGSFLTNKVSIYHQLENSDEWISLLTKSEESHKDLILGLSEDDSKIMSTKNSAEIYAQLRLVDSSKIGIVNGEKFDGSTYFEIDKITFQIFIQILDSAYQAFIAHGKEKELIFSLNNRLSQLYSLIDTGIELSKIGTGSKLIDLALSRAISLTNSSFGKVKVTNSSEEVEEYYFPPGFKFKLSDVSESLIKTFIDNSIK